MAFHFSMYRKDEELSKAYYCAIRMALQSPLMGYFYRWQGLVGVNPEQFKQLMAEKIRTYFVPGGFEEASLTSDKYYTLYMEHKGFIKYAMQYGYKIRPFFAFNENKAYPKIDKLYNLRLLLNKYKIRGTLFYSKNLPLFPDTILNMEIVVANGFEVTQVINPTNQQINEEYKRYFQFVNQIYNKYKQIYNPTALDIRYYQDGKFHIMPPSTPRL